MADTIYLRGEGGGIFAMDLPLPEGIADRFERGLLVRVHPDGTPHHEASQAASPSPGGSALTVGRIPRPTATARKTDWVAWAVAVHSMEPADADALTLTQLKDLPEQPATEGTRAQADGRPDESADKADWTAYVVARGLLSAEDAANYTKDDLIDMVS